MVVCGSKMSEFKKQIFGNYDFPNFNEPILALIANSSSNKYLDTSIEYIR